MAKGASSVANKATKRITAPAERHQGRRMSGDHCGRQTNSQSKQEQKNRKRTWELFSTFYTPFEHPKPLQQFNCSKPFQLSQAPSTVCSPEHCQISGSVQISEPLLASVYKCKVDIWHMLYR